MDLHGMALAMIIRQVERGGIKKLACQEKSRGQIDVEEAVPLRTSTDEHVFTKLGATSPTLGSSFVVAG